MQIRKLFPYLTQGVVVGLVIGFIAIKLFTDDSGSETRPVVEFKESPQQIARGEPSGNLLTSFADAVEQTSPAVVNIHTSKVVTQRLHPFFDDPAFRQFFGDSGNFSRKRLETSLGSGVIVSTQGYVLTNHHVIKDADEILVGLNDGRSIAAQVVGTDPETDLAVLKISLDNLVEITLGHSDSLRVGDIALAIGNPFGIGQTVTQGIISATGRHQLGISTFENFIQTDAAINPGNSGGALINTDGELIGINTAIFSQSGGSQGVGFAIPIDLAKNVMKQIIEHGQTVRGWLGIDVQSLTPALAESFGLQDTHGVIIAGIMSDGPAGKAGLQPGDVITAIDGKAIDDPTRALNLIAQATPNSKVKIQGIRNNQPFTVEAIVSIRPQAK